MTLQGNSSHKGSSSDEEDGTAGRSQGRWWVGSVGHEEVLRLTDLEEFFQGKDKPKGGDEEGENLDQDLDATSNPEDDGDGTRNSKDELEGGLAVQSTRPEEIDTSDSESDGPQAPRKRKLKPEKNPLVVKKKRGRNEVDVERTFFDGL